MFSDKTIEEYQLILMRNPSAKVFAPLAEAYRKMGLLQQALEICERGIKYNPDYPSGLVAYGKILFELKKYEQASQMFTKATQLKRDNILAYKLNALSLIKLNRYPEALKAYKHVLYFSPQDEQAKKFIANWEYLEAPGFSEKTFLATSQEEKDIIAEADPSRVTNLIEALLARNEIDRAQSIAHAAIELWPKDKQLLKQLKVIADFQKEEAQEQAELKLNTLAIKRQFLNRLLRRIELAKKVDRNRPHPFNT